MNYIFLKLKKKKTIVVSIQIINEKTRLLLIMLYSISVII